MAKEKAGGFSRQDAKEQIGVDQCCALRVIVAPSFSNSAAESACSAVILFVDGNFIVGSSLSCYTRQHMVPNKVFFTKGAGIHKERLASFEMALRVAGLAHCNLVLVSSIYPPGCKIIPKEEGLKLLRPGEIVFAVYDRESNNEPNRLSAASVGMAVPADSSMHGYLSEHHSFGETDEKAGEYAEDLAATMLATTLGIEFDPELDWDEREQIFKMSGKIVRTTNITQSAVGNKDGLWTTVFAAAVFINDNHLAVETTNATAANDKGPLQEQVLTQTLEGQLKNTPAHEQLTHRYKEAAKSAIEPARVVSSARKNL